MFVSVGHWAKCSLLLFKVSSFSLNLAKAWMDDLSENWSRRQRRLVRSSSRDLAQPALFWATDLPQIWCFPCF